MAKIIINRKSGFMHRVRKFQVFIDGQKAGEIKNGSSEEFAVAQGTHHVHCKVDWYSSNEYEVQLAENEVKFLVVKSGMKYFGVMYLLLFISLVLPLVFRNQPWVSRDTLEWIRIAALAIVIAYGGYYSLFGRKKYLKLEVDTKNIFSS